MKNTPNSRLEMHTDDRGQTTTQLFVNGTDISDRMASLSLHVDPTHPIMAEIVLYIDEVDVSADVVKNILKAVLPGDIQRQLPAIFGEEQYDGTTDAENSPRTFG